LGLPVSGDRRRSRRAQKKLTRRRIKMKVWVVCSNTDWETREEYWQCKLIGVFSTKQKAMEVSKEINGSYYEEDVYEVEVDSIANLLLYQE
jgi:hypothetical protein